MNYLVQHGKVRGQMIEVPNGLPELLSDITREVLRCQPTADCLCQFIIDYLHSVIETREKALIAKAIIERALREVDQIIEDVCVCEIDPAKAKHMAEVLESCFKKFVEHRRCETRRQKEIIAFGEEDLLDELIKRIKFSDEELKISRAAIEESYNKFINAYLAAAKGEGTNEALYQYFQERERIRAEIEAKNLAATKIQATFRGFMVRRTLVFERHTTHLFDNEEFERMNQAARKIQNYFRQYQDFKQRGSEAFYEEEPTVCDLKSSEVALQDAKPKKPKDRAEQDFVSPLTPQISLAELLRPPATTEEPPAEEEVSPEPEPAAEAPPPPPFELPPEPTAEEAEVSPESFGEEVVEEAPPAEVVVAEAVVAEEEAPAAPAEEAPAPEETADPPPPPPAEEEAAPAPAEEGEAAPPAE